ncbi:MAG: 50S ribosomal protein L15e [Candidatus Woesearchaeota archaeon]
MGYLKYVREAWKRPKTSEFWKQRLMQFRREPAMLRLEHPTRPDRARSLGYRAKQGFIIVRQRVSTGGHKRLRPAGGRRPKAARKRMVLDKSHKRIAEERASRNFPNCEVLNSYWVANDSRYQWYEILLVDRAHPVVKSDKRMSWVSDDSQKGRAERGLTSSGKKSRGLNNKGKGAEKLRPSKSAVHRKKMKKPRKD